MKFNSSMFGISTNCGPKQVNEDSCYIHFDSKRKMGIALVADGMGGYQAGDRASQLIANSIRTWWHSNIAKMPTSSLSIPKISVQLEGILYQLNDELLNLKSLENINAGTTVSLIFFLNERYLIKHVGDSRIYKITSHKQLGQTNLDETTPLYNDIVSKYERSSCSISQLTEDHSWVDIQVKQGRLTAEEARLHPKRNVLLQCLGIEKHLDIYTISGEYTKDDLFLLCSDGFYSLFNDYKISTMIAEHHENTLQYLSDKLVNMAVHSDGVSDNISVIITTGPLVNASHPRSLKERIRAIFK